MLDFQDCGPFGILKLNYPRTNNLNLDSLPEILASLQRVDALATPKVLVMTSDLPFGFSAGLDLGSLFQIDDPETTANNMCQAVRLVYEINQLLLRSKKIYIAALAGPVIGLAFSIALSCDFRIGVERTWFWVPEPQYGGLPADGSVEISNHKIGAARTAILFLTNERVNAAKAYEWGLLYQIAGNDQLNETAYALAERLAGYAPETLGATKELINAAVPGPFDHEKLWNLVNSKESHQKLRPYMKPGSRQ